MHESKITPVSTRMANVMKKMYNAPSTPPTLLRSLNLPMNSTIHKQETAINRDATTKSMPLELMRTAGFSRPCLMFTKHLMNQGMPNANRIANELAPKALDTPIPPSPKKYTSFSIYES